METVDSAKREVAIIKGVLEVVPAEAAKEATGHYSSLCARITLEVLRHYQIRVRALPCVVAAFNDRFMEMIRATKQPPADLRELQAWRKTNGSSAIGLFDGLPTVVVVTHPRQDEEFDGVLVDTALDQLSSPQFGIVMHPLAATVPKGFIDGSQFLMARSEDITVRYQRITNDDWTQSQGWRDPNVRAKAIERSIAKIDLKLHGQDLWNGS